MNRLKELRQKNGVKQKDIASMLGVTAGAVSQWENGEAEEEASAGTEAAGEENRAESWKESQEENREETWKVNQEEIREETWKESQTDIPAEPEHESGCGKEGGQYA